MTKREYEVVCELLAKKNFSIDYLIDDLYDYAKKDKEDGNRVLELYSGIKFDKEYQRCMKDPLEEEPWKDGKHLGDCTNDPCSCCRCLYEESIEDVKKELNKLGIDEPES